MIAAVPELIKSPSPNLNVIIQFFGKAVLGLHLYDSNLSAFLLSHGGPLGITYQAILR